MLKVLEDIRTSAGPDYFHPAISDPQDDRLLCLLENVSCDLGLEDRSFRKALRAIVRMSTAEAVEKHLSAAAVLKGSIRPDLMLRFIAGMEKTESLRPYADLLNEAPPEVQVKARVLANAVSALCEVGDFGFNSGKKQFYVTHPKLEAAVLANPARTREYAEFCASRGSADSLDEIDSVPTAVRSGLL